MSSPELQTAATLATVDARARLTLPGKAGRHYTITEDDLGVITLEPAVVMSQAQIDAILAKSRATPDSELRPRPPRRTS